MTARARRRCQGTDAEAAWREVGGQPSILEAFVPFVREVSVVAARAADGTVECFDVTENEHRDHILKVSRVPAAVSDATAQEARRIAETIAHHFGYVGVLAVEMFVLGRRRALGERDRAAGPQFRALDARRRLGVAIRAAHPGGGRLAARQADPQGRVEMINLIGHEVDDYRKWLTVPGAAVHLYGKTAVRPGRKMGHVTRALCRLSEPRKPLAVQSDVDFHSAILVESAPRWHGRLSPHPDPISRAH